jgi:hypothetical protein
VNLKRTWLNVAAIFVALVILGEIVSGSAGVANTSLLGTLAADAAVAAARPAGGTRTVSVTDPIFNMRAYSYTIPDGWLFDGAAIPGTSCGGGIVPVFRAIRPDGLVGIKSLPRMDWAWSNNPTLAKKDEQPDCLAYKKTLTAQEFMQYMIGVLQVQFVRMEPVPWLAQRQRETAAQNRPGSQSTVDIAIATVHYRVNKITIEEQIQVNVYCHSNSLGASGQYQNSCNAGVLRRWAPEGKLEANQDTFKAILQSFNIDQEWQARYDQMMVQEIKDRAARDGAMLQRQMDTANRQMAAQYNQFNQSQAMRQKQHDDFLAVMQRGTDMSMNRTGEAMNARSRAADDWCDYSLDQQKRLDPNTGLITKDSSAYNYTWVNEQGDRVQTNNINANPNGNGNGNWTLQENVR